jgi:hypothetical protein
MSYQTVAIALDTESNFDLAILDWLKISKCDSSDKGGRIRAMIYE